MALQISGIGERVVAFMDLGTNSVRLLIVRINANQSYSIISQQKETIRLGESEFTDQRLHPEAMTRALMVCRRFVEMAHSRGADEIDAVATAATREAGNQGEFLRRFQAETGIPLHVISGREEARLIYLGVSSGVHLANQQALFIDIGGGSTEVSVGNQHAYRYLDSLKLGAIRLSTIFLHGRAGPIPAKLYADIREHVRNVAVRTMQHLREFHLERAYGSSGTIETLANVAACAIHKREPVRYHALSARDLAEVSTLLCGQPLEERRRVPGMNPDRADIIIGGMAIVSVFMEELGLQQIIVSERGLRDGLLVDYLEREVYHPEMADLSVRARSVRQLGRLCKYDERHAEQVATLALALFDSAKTLGLHHLGAWERELLQWAAHLHDIGMFLTFGGHHAHSQYFILNADLLGFDQREIGIMAATAYFHRKAVPRKKHAALGELDPEAQEIVRVISLFLRLAESLDRSHAGLVTEAHFALRVPGHLALEFTAPHGGELEAQSARKHADAVQKLFGVSLTVVHHTATAPAQE